MSKITLCALLIGIFFNAPAQKFGHFSTDDVVNKMPTHRQAQSEIDALSHTWMNEIKDKYREIGNLENKLQSEKILLTTEMIRDREREIETKLKEATDYQYQVFGPYGLFFLKKQELIRPDMDKISEAAERVCKKHNLDYLMDKSSGPTLVYTNPVHDYTDFILEELGLGDPHDTIK